MRPADPLTPTQRAAGAWPRSGRRPATGSAPRWRRRRRTAAAGRWPGHSRDAAPRAETSQDRLAVIAGHRHHLRQQAAAVGSRQPVIPFALSRQILSDTRPRHGYPLVRGNRTVATYASSPVTIILRRCVLLP